MILIGQFDSPFVRRVAIALDGMDAVESRDAHEIITERHRAGSMTFTSNRGPDEWLQTAEVMDQIPNEHGQFS